MMTFIELTGFLAGSLTTACSIPHIFHIIKTKDTGGISLISHGMLVCGIFLWLCYGMFLIQLPLIICNIVSLVGNVTVILCKLIYDGKKKYKNTAILKGHDISL